MLSFRCKNFQCKLFHWLKVSTGERVFVRRKSSLIHKDLTCKIVFQKISKLPRKRPSDQRSLLAIKKLPIIHIIWNGFDEAIQGRIRESPRSSFVLFFLPVAINFSPTNGRVAYRRLRSLAKINFLSQIDPAFPRQLKLAFAKIATDYTLPVTLCAGYLLFYIRRPINTRLHKYRRGSVRSINRCHLQSILTIKSDWIGAAKRSGWVVFQDATEVLVSRLDD